MATTVRALSGDAELLERLTATPFAATVHSVFDRVANLRLPYDGQLCTVATVGNTGGNPESGLYFEIRRQGQPIDPLSWATLK